VSDRKTRDNIARESTKCTDIDDKTKSYDYPRENLRNDRQSLTLNAARETFSDYEIIRQIYYNTFTLYIRNLYRYYMGGTQNQYLHNARVPTLLPAQQCVHGRILSGVNIQLNR